MLLASVVDQVTRVLPGGARRPAGRSACASGRPVCVMLLHVRCVRSETLAVCPSDERPLTLEDWDDLCAWTQHRGGTSQLALLLVVLLIILVVLVVQLAMMYQVGGTLVCSGSHHAMLSKLLCQVPPHHAKWRERLPEEENYRHVSPREDRARVLLCCEGSCSAACCRGF